MAAFVPSLGEKKKETLSLQCREAEPKWTGLHQQHVEKEAGREKKDREGDLRRLRRVWHCYLMQSETVLL